MKQLVSLVLCLAVWILGSSRALAQESRDDRIGLSAA